MRIKKYCITLILLLFGVGIAHSQESRTEICVDFRVNSTVIDSAYSDNAARMQEIIEFLRNIHQDSTINIVEISFCGAASTASWHEVASRHLKSSSARRWIFPTASLPVMTATSRGII